MCDQVCGIHLHIYHIYSNRHDFSLAGVRLLIKGSSYPRAAFIIPCACTRGKVINSVVVVVVVDTKIAKSQKKIGVGHWTACFKSLRTAHEHYR